MAYRAVTNAKRKISRATGIPTTKSGRRRKAAKAMSGGCLLPALVMVCIPIGILTLLLNL